MSEKPDLPVPWGDFLGELDALLDEPIQLHCIGGFAVVAYPAKYGNSGIMSFIVNNDGTVYEKDLGPNTAKTAAAMKAYNPDSSWTEVK